MLILHRQQLTMRKDCFVFKLKIFLFKLNFMIKFLYVNNGEAYVRNKRCAI